jgi:hypothetical protein
MSLSGIAITLCDDLELRAAALEILERDARLTLGPARGPRVAAVLEASSPDEGRAAFERLAAEPGVLQVDLVCVYEIEEPGDPPAELGSKS